MKQALHSLTSELEKYVWPDDPPNFSQLVLHLPAIKRPAAQNITTVSLHICLIKPRPVHKIEMVLWLGEILNQACSRSGC
jgi:hypothetical protein